MGDVESARQAGSSSSMGCLCCVYDWMEFVPYGGAHCTIDRITHLISKLTLPFHLLSPFPNTPLQFEFTGSSCWSATFSGNSVKGSQSGQSRVTFASDGATVTWSLPSIHIRGEGGCSGARVQGVRSMTLLCCCPLVLRCAGLGFRPQGG